MAKSAIYTVNSTAPVIPAGAVIPVGNTIRRFGCNMQQDGNTITLIGKGYYLVNVAATVTPSAAGTETLSMQKDGVDIIGATSSVTVAATDTAVSMNITAIVRNICDCGSSLLSFVLGEEGTVNNLAVTVVKL